jgi:hypothetical protein
LKIPTRAESRQLLEEASEKNPGDWVQHTLYMVLPGVVEKKSSHLTPLINFFLPPLGVEFG